jgi:hypothetical protein
VPAAARTATSADASQRPVPAPNASRWLAEADELRAFVETRCWSSDKQSYVRFAGTEELDAGLLLGVLAGYGDPTGERLSGTIEAIRRKLTDGPYVHRYSGEDGLSGSEGAFLACSFWLAESLARAGRVDEATRLMGELVTLALHAPRAFRDASKRPETALLKPKPLGTHFGTLCRNAAMQARGRALRHSQRNRPLGAPQGGCLAP